MEILGMKNVTTEMEITFNGLNRRLDTLKENLFRIQQRNISLWKKMKGKLDIKETIKRRNVSD